MGEPHILAAIEKGLLRVGSVQLHGDSRSVVACILRKCIQETTCISSRNTRGQATATTSPTSTSQLSSSAHASATASDLYSELDVFFILRSDARRGATANAARWGGQVAFPGGHVDVGETDTAAVVREVREEVGFHLDQLDRYRFLGEVTPRTVSRVRDGKPSSLVVSCHVYLQLDETSENVVPDPSEVAAAGWAPLSSLLGSSHTAPLNWSELHSTRGVDFDHLPSVHLPLRCVTVASGVDPDDATRRFRLWGLTLRIVNDWLIMCGLRTVPIGDDMRSSL